MEYIGHTSDDGRKQLLLDHLNGTSKLCRENVNEFWADIAEFVGQIHDIGKYTSGFQKRINGAENMVERLGNETNRQNPAPGTGNLLRNPFPQRSRQCRLSLHAG